MRIPGRWMTVELPVSSPVSFGPGIGVLLTLPSGECVPPTGLAQLKHIVSRLKQAGSEDSRGLFPIEIPRDLLCITSMLGDAHPREGPIQKESAVVYLDASELVKLEQMAAVAAQINGILRYGPRPHLTVDGILAREGTVLLVKRKHDPFRDRWALPGGFVNYRETLEDAVVREVEEETGLHTSVRQLLGVYSHPDRDPRDHTVSSAFILQGGQGEPCGGDDAQEARFHPLGGLPELAFDHTDIISDALGVLGQ
jgi:8-oxo-dGTP diphosphatase